MIPPTIGTFWIHRRGGRVCKVIATYLSSEGKRLVDFQYRLGVGNIVTRARGRQTPTQTLELSVWLGLFTKETT